jgi:virulence factor Mce-like protein
VNPRSKRSSLAANPVLIGAATVLIALVAVVLAYNANSGLPFVKTYNFKAEVPDASGLIVGNDVRKGGSRVGFVSAITPREGTDGSTGATIDIKLDQKNGPIPADSRIEVRPKSVLGLKYVQLTSGRSKRMLQAGRTILLRYAGGKPVELDDLFNTFDEPTRKASAENLNEFGTALAGRGDELNETIAGLRPLLMSAEPALRNLTDPSTGFARLFPALERVAAEVAPVAQSQANLITGLRQTFTALDRVRGPLQETIAYGPEALQAGITELPQQARFMRSSTELFRRLRPAFASLANASPGLAGAFEAGTPALRRSPALNRRLVTTLKTLEDFGTDDRTLQGLAQLGGTARILRPTAAYIKPAQTTCNYITLLTRNLARVLSVSTQNGSSLFTGPVILAEAPDSEGGPAAKPANGPVKGPPEPPRAPTGRVIDNFLHSNPYPYTAAPGQPKECEAGNEVYVPGKQVIGNTPANEGIITEDQKVGAK